MVSIQYQQRWRVREEYQKSPEVFQGHNYGNSQDEYHRSIIVYDPRYFYVDWYDFVWEI